MNVQFASMNKFKYAVGFKKAKWTYSWLSLSRISYLITCKYASRTEKHWSNSLSAMRRQCENGRCNVVGAHSRACPTIEHHLNIQQSDEHINKDME